MSLSPAWCGGVGVGRWYTRALCKLWGVDACRWMVVGCV